MEVQDRVAEWRQRGWSGHNPGAEPLSADELRREREYYSASQRQADEWEREEREGTRWPHDEAQPIESSLAESSRGSRIYNK